MTFAHARQAIRAGAAGLLRVNPDAWATVLETRLAPTRTKGDYLMVFGDADSAEADTADSPQQYERRCNIVIVGWLRLPGNTDRETIENKMDAMAAEVESKITFAALQAVAGLNKLKGLSLTTTEMEVLVDAADKPDHAELTMLYVADYTTAEGFPATLI